MPEESKQDNFNLFSVMWKSVHGNRKTIL